MPMKLTLEKKKLSLAAHHVRIQWFLYQAYPGTPPNKFKPHLVQVMPSTSLRWHSRTNSAQQCPDHVKRVDQEVATFEDRPFAHCVARCKFFLFRNSAANLSLQEPYFFVNF
ncbi:unnamed protein product [Cylicostephanus goldi]|uniref:Uncharacterized protein n=1 Tax=Cylicostephanus goldi TaxID=71465 RepID=A0A3P7MR21_CYLGO|nr:unnamed protein product [Cylicostephanus goldi]